MATPIHTAGMEGADEGMPNESSIDLDYVEVLNGSLRAQNLMYIADIIMEIEKEPLEDLMCYSRKNLIDLLDEIHEDKTNEYRIKVSHRNRFAKTVIEMGAKRAVSSSEQQTSQASKVKLLFLDQEEQKAIQSIQSTQQFMQNNLDKTKKLFIHLDENDKMVRQNLHQICNVLKHQIEDKQKQMISCLDSIYQYRLNEFNERHAITQKAAKMTAEFYNDYENYFMDNKLSKLERKNKLITAQNKIAVETRRVSKCNKDMPANMNIVLNKKAVNQFFNQCLDLTNIGINLPAVTIRKVYGTVIKWKAPQINDDVLAVFSKRKKAISYTILYRHEMAEQKMNKDDWQNISDLCGKINEFDMARYAPCEAKIQYSIHNLLRSPVSQIVKIESDINVNRRNNNNDDKKDDLIATRWNSRGNISRLGATGKYYCGQLLLKRCSCCDGRCGPTNGCNCCSCMQLDVKYRMLPQGYLVNKLGFISRISFDTGHFYCGRKIGKQQPFHDGYCGPGNGPNCVACKVLDTNSNKIYGKLFK